jgi:hypothetical protein
VAAALRQLVGLQHENRKHSKRRLSATSLGSRSRGVSGATAGSPMTDIRKFERGEQQVTTGDVLYAVGQTRRTPTPDP